MTSLVLAALSFICIVLAYLHMLFWDRRERTRRPETYCPPPKVTWILWFFVDLALLYSARGPIGKVQMFAYAIGSLIMSIYAQRRGTPGLSRDDYKILGLGTLALIAWCFSGGVLAAALLVAATSVGARELCRELRINPKAYGFFGWWLFLWGNVAAIFALSEVERTPENLTAPLGFLVIQSVILWFTLREPPWRRRGLVADLSPLLVWLMAPEEVPIEEEQPFRRAA